MFEYRAKVKRVVDGDTVDFTVDLGFGVKIDIRTRLAGVDTPERGHEDWAKATNKCIELLQSVGNPSTAPVKGTEVIIRTHKTGKYGRWIAEIDGVTDELAKIWPYNR
jgi:micrococcal nuclease